MENITSIKHNEKVYHIIIPLKRNFVRKYNPEKVKALGDVTLKRFKEIFQTYWIIIERNNKVNSPHMHLACKVEYNVDVQTIEEMVNTIKVNIVEDLKDMNFVSKDFSLHYNTRNIFIECTEEIKSQRYGILKVNDNNHLHNLGEYFERKKGNVNTIYFNKVS